MPTSTELIAERRARPSDDLMTRLLEVELGRGRRAPRSTDDDIRGFFILLATAGNETVTKLLATAFHGLWSIPDQRRILVADPAESRERRRGAPCASIRPRSTRGASPTRDVELHGAPSRRARA